MKSSYNYKTFYTGTPKRLESCPLIYFFDTRELGTRLSLDNLDKIKEIVSLKNPMFCIRGEDGLFTKSLEGLKKYEFDLLLFCESSLDYESKTNPIIGYTVFSDPQRTYTNAGNTFGELIISVFFRRNEDKESDPVISILNTFRITQSEVDLRGPQKFNYPTDTDVLPMPDHNYLRYSNRVVDVKNDNSLGVVTDTGVIYGSPDLSYSRLFIRQGLVLDKDIYTHFLLGTYKNDIVVCKFNIKDGNFCISSLSRVNKFKRPYDYISGYIDTSTIDGCELLYYAYSYLVFWDAYNAQYIIHFLEDGQYSIYPRLDEETGGNSYVVVDARDPEGKYKYLPDTKLFEEITKTCITPMKKDSSGKWVLDLDKRDYIFLEKIGSWWVLQKVSTNDFYYLSPYGCVISKLKLSIINDRLFKTQDGIFFPIEFGHTYKYPVHSWPRDMTDLKKVGIQVKSGKTWMELDKTQECLLDGLRRKPIRLREAYPSPAKILGALYGLTFYMDGGLLYCY